MGCEGSEEIGTCEHLYWDCKMCRALWERNMEISPTSNVEVVYSLPTPLMGIISKELKAGIQMDS